MAARIGAVFTNNARIKLQRVEKDMQKHLLKHLETSAEDIAELARLNVPVDSGTVEHSIIVERPRRNGLNFSYTFAVGVNTNRFLSTARKRKENWTDHPYFDVWLHESIYNLSKKSLEKDNKVRSINPHAKVGNKYLSRAVQSLQGEINEKAEIIVQKVKARRSR